MSPEELLPREKHLRSRYDVPGGWNGRDAPCVELVLEPRSLVVFTDQAYRLHRHSVLPGGITVPPLSAIPSTLHHETLDIAEYGRHKRRLLSSKMKR